jgi:hypothetical protein
MVSVKKTRPHYYTVENSNFQWEGENEKEIPRLDLLELKIGIKWAYRTRYKKIPF